VTDGAYAYVASGLYGVVVVDVREPENPVGIGSVSLGFVPVHLDGNESYLVATGGIHGIAVVDASDPYAPQVVGSLAGYYALEVAVDGEYCYLADPAGYITVVDVSDATRPVAVAELQVGGSPMEIVVVEGYAYVAAGSMLLAIDVRVPADPVVISSLPVHCQRVTAEPGLAYIDEVSYGGIQVVDTSNRADLAVVGCVYTGTLVERFVANGGFIYGANRSLWGSSSGLAVFDAGDPSDPLLAATRLSDGSALGVAVAGSHAYLASSAGGLHVFEVSDPYGPILVGAAQ
jgi:hypothetical protein